jgi:TolA-binding protein
MDTDTTKAALLKYAHADLLSFQNKDSLALLTLDSILKAFPKHSLTDEVWFKKAQIMKKEGNYTLALSYLKDVVDSFPDDILADDALFQIGDLYEHVLNDKDKAKENYELLLTKYPGSLFVSDARKRFRILRGDKLN